MFQLNQVNLLCRAGFEKECAGELISLAQQAQIPAYVQTTENSGVVHLLASTPDNDMQQLLEEQDFSRLIFPRQWFVSASYQLDLPENDRLTPLMNYIKQFCLHNNLDGFTRLEMDYSDTNDGKSLNKFCRQFSKHVERALKAGSLLSKQFRWQLHLLFEHSQAVTIGISLPENSSPFAMGIPRLKMPADAPSRSTLKLDEAIQWFLNTHQQHSLFTRSSTAVDLGAAPGGWTWQLVKRNCRVIAIDNGPMQQSLLDTGMVEHYQTDAFTYQPPRPVNWLVCDMAERPLHVSRLIARWFTSGFCEHAIFNLKLPMKKRLASVEDCLQLLSQELSVAGIKATIKARQLYHDREEVTVCILTSE